MDWRGWNGRKVAQCRSAAWRKLGVELGDERLGFALEIFPRTQEEVNRGYALLFLFYLTMAGLQEWLKKARVGKSPPPIKQDLDSFTSQAAISWALNWRSWRQRRRSFPSTSSFFPSSSSVGLPFSPCPLLLWSWSWVPSLLSFTPAPPASPFRWGSTFDFDPSMDKRTKWKTRNWNR